MSSYYTYFFKAPLRDRYADQASFLKRAGSEGVRFDLESARLAQSSDTPSFGPNTRYTGPSFSHWGLSIEDGVLSIGVFAENLERSQDDNEGGIERPDSPTRLENLLRFLSEVTTGDEGEIQGAYCDERWDYEDHAHPIVRCSDGCLRVARTSVTPYDPMGYDSEREKNPIPGILPAGIVASGFNGAFVKIDPDALSALSSSEFNSPSALSTHAAPGQP